MDEGRKPFRRHSKTPIAIAGSTAGLSNPFVDSASHLLARDDMAGPTETLLSLEWNPAVLAQALTRWSGWAFNLPLRRLAFAERHPSFHGTTGR
jgi:hypothetical protein